MNICSIGCYFRDDIYSHNYDLTSSALGESLANKVKRVTSNCNCYSSSRWFGITRNSC